MKTIRNNDRKNNSVLDKIKNIKADDITSFVRKYIKYCIGAALAVVLVIIIIVGANVNEGSKSSTAQSTSADENTYTDIVDETDNEDLYKLLSDYYTAYASDDEDTLKTIATPFSDDELSYIKLMSNYINSYDIRKIYTQPGLKDTDKMVSVYVEISFLGQNTAAPGLDFFYVETDESGSYIINNLYSAYNQQSGSQKMDSDIVSKIAEYEEEQDVIDLQASVQKEFDQATMQDKDLDTFINTTLPDSVKEWSKNPDDAIAAAQASAEAAASEESSEESTESTESAETADAESEESKDTESAESTESTETADAKSDSSDSGSDSSDNSESASSSSEKKYVVTTDVVNVRKKASKNAKSYGTVRKGKRFRVFGTKGDWTKVRYKGHTGYILTEYLKETTADNSSKDSPYSKGDKVTVDSPTNIRKKASKSSRRVAIVYKNEYMTVIRSGSKWTKVSFNGDKGYVLTSLLKK